jgi:hypothetical protein
VTIKGAPRLQKHLPRRARRETRSVAARFLSSLSGALALLLYLSPCIAAVRVIVGPTPIPDGQANTAGDLTLVNEKLAASIAVNTSPPWAIPKGALIDAAPVVNGKIQRDRVAFADFLPNGWSAWPSAHQRVEIVTETPALAVVRATRDWNAVQIVTTYTLRAGDDFIHIVVTMTNRGTTSVTDALSGLVLWAQGGYFFGVPGLPHQMSGSASGAMTDRIVAYDKDWLIALHEPVFDRFNYAQKDLYLRHTLAPGQGRTFEGWLQIVGQGDMAPVVTNEIHRRNLPSGTVAGAVQAAGGSRVTTPVVVVERDGVPYAWTLGQNGHYTLELPAGRYTLYATSEGYSESSRVVVSLRANESVRQDFAGLMPPGRLLVSVSDARSRAPLDARLDIKTGQKPVVEYLGKHVFFTDLQPKGSTQINLAPGHYVLSIGSGAGFSTKALDVPVSVISGGAQPLAVAIDRLFKPDQDGWYSADLHHHSDQEDGVSPPAELARSELAAGLDVLFVSDHDSSVNHRVLQDIADERGVPFIASIELSPSWGHFNVYPIRLGAAMSLEMNKATVQEVFAEAHRMGAELIQVNHPYNPGEGYFASLDRGVASGGFDPDFNFLEINGAESDKDEQTVAAAWKFWNDGKRYYLAAGSDTHDVWNDRSGDARVYVHVQGSLTPASFLDGLKQGHAFVSHGPLVFSDPMFGTTATLQGGSVGLAFHLESVAGLKRATVICRGQPVKVVDYSAGETTSRIVFSATAAGFCAVTVEDVVGKTAYSDPIWVEAPKSATGIASPAMNSGVEVSNPFAYCERVGTNDRLTGAGSASSEASAKILEPYLRAALELPAETPLPVGSVFWRCMQGKVYVCAVGANLPCGSKADQAKRNRGAETYCRENPATTEVPAFATGHETIYSWRCAAGKALRGAPIAELDRRGFRTDIWHVVTK